MGMWGYVILAYGVVWSAILLYTVSLKRRCRQAEAELAELRGGKDDA